MVSPKISYMLYRSYMHWIINKKKLKIKNHVNFSYPLICKDRTFFFSRLFNCQLTIFFFVIYKKGSWLYKAHMGRKLEAPKRWRRDGKVMQRVQGKALDFFLNKNPRNLNSRCLNGKIVLSKFQNVEK